MTRHVSLRHNRRVDNPFQNIRRQPRAVEIQVTIFPNLAPADRIDSGFHSHFGRAEGITDETNFFFGLEFTLGPEWIALGAHPDAEPSKLIRKS